MNGTGSEEWGADLDYQNWKELHEMTKIWSVVFPVVITSILVLGLISNALVVYVTIVTNRTAKHPIHSIFVLNLAAADVIFLLVSGPHWIIIMQSPTWIFGEFLCPVIYFVSNCSMAASIYTICALAWMRFMALIMPFRFRKSCISTRKAGYFVILALWLAGVILSLPYLIYYRVHEEEYMGGNKTYSCQWDKENLHSMYVNGVATLIATYLFPLLLVTVFYVVIGREVLCYMKHRRDSVNRGTTEEQKECVKSTVVVLCLILAFLVCWFPHLLQTVFTTIGFWNENEHIKDRYFLEVLGKCMAYAHAFINPFIYTFASPIFRRSLRSSLRQRVLRCKNGKSACGGRCPINIVNRGNLNNRQQRMSLDIIDKHVHERADTHKTTVVTPNSEHVAMTTAVDCHSATHLTYLTKKTSPDMLRENKDFAESNRIEENADEERKDLLTVNGQKSLSSPIDESVK